MTATYHSGNTVRLSAVFKDWNGEIVDPPIVKLIIYDSFFTKIEEYSIATKNEKGEFYFDFVTNEDRTIIYEWYAEVEGTPSLIRDKITFRRV